MEKELPKRKPTRLKNFDYSSAGVYFVTICIRDRMNILSEIVKTDLTATEKTNGLAVGEGLAPPEITVKLKPCGEIAKEQLQLIEARFPSVTIEDYVIMPDHIHVVIFLHEKAGGASPSPTLDDVICAFKSLTADRGTFFLKNCRDRRPRLSENKRYARIPPFVLRNCLRFDGRRVVAPTDMGSNANDPRGFRSKQTTIPKNARGSLFINLKSFFGKNVAAYQKRNA